MEIRVGKSPNDLWEEIGSVVDEEMGHVITKLFTIYEQKLEVNPEDGEALEFFKNLEVALAQTVECNLNRR